ncbi:MAG: hypothetical protein ACI33P_05725 [Lysinibacillus sp.]
MGKEFRMYVTNITQAISVLREAGIEASTFGTAIKLHIPEEGKTDVIVLLNKEKVVVYDIEEI